MSFPYYQGEGNREDRGEPAKLPGSRHTQLLDPANYLADSGLRDACNVALLLNQPLLLTGEPGTGKTEFARSLAWELQLGDPLKFETKSSSTGQELFYSYDALKRFEAIQTESGAGKVLDYLRYGPLGEAILRSREPGEIAQFLPEGFDHSAKTRSVVLIDEVDKAPRDFPNDILNELERRYFRIPELGNARIDADPELQPVVIITSNSEKDLPDAFLRRCIYYDVPFPDRERLDEIVSNRLGLQSAGTSEFMDQALDLFGRLRARAAQLRKPPATAELLGWMMSLQEIAGDQENPLANPELVRSTLSSLIKTKDDQARAPRVVEEWIKEFNKTTPDSLAAG